MTDKILYTTPYLQLVERDGWYYFARIPGSSGGVSILVYRLGEHKSVLGRYEKTVSHGDEKPTLTSVAGGIEEGELPLAAAVRETREETGYDVDASEFESLGRCTLSTNQDTIIHLFAVDVTGKERGEAVPDGTKGEEDAYCDWVTAREAIMSKSAYMSALMMRLYVMSGVRLV